MTPQAPEGTQPETDQPPQQVTETPPASPGGDWQARYSGQVLKLQELTLRVRDLEGQLAVAASDKERLRTELTTQTTNADVVAREKEAFVKTSSEEKLALEKELAELRSLKAKVDVVNELGKPELIGVLNGIPGLTDTDAIKNVVESLDGYTNSRVVAREDQLRAGITPPVTQASSAPTSSKTWLQQMNDAPLGSPERHRALKEYGKALRQENQ